MESYRRISKLGSGEYGTVWLVEKEGVRYAMKEFGYEENEDTLTEIFLSLENDHPNLIKGKEFFIQDERIYLILELADSTLTDTFLEYVEEETIVRLFYELLSAVHFLHKSKFYHCDIKPNNIFLKNRVLKLGDFGLARFFHSPPSICQADTYAPPEEYRKRAEFFVPRNFCSIFFQPVQRRYSDIWACGAVFVYMLLRGRRHFINSKEELLSYIRNPLAYLTKLGIREEYLPILLTILQPEQSLRVRTVKDILAHDFFISRGYRDPIRGFNLWKPLEITLTVDAQLREDFLFFIKVVDYKSHNIFATNSAINFYYLLYERLGKGRNNVFSFSCVLLSNILYGEAEYTEDFLCEFKNAPPPDRVKELIIEIVREMKGVLYFPTFATLAFSTLALNKSMSFLLDPLIYPELDIIAFMKELEALETPEEREKRAPVTYETRE